MAKVGLLVVYIFDDTMQQLFDIHLDHIKRLTNCDYKIYATGHKLAKKQFDYVAANPEIDLVSLDVPKEFGIRKEHSHCLRELADIAFEDGCEHVICMHLDSFPLVEGWQDTFIGPLKRGEADVVSIVPNGYSAGLCWSKDFEDGHSPNMRVGEDERKTSEFQSFVEDFPDFDHIETGIGIIFTAYKEKLAWKRVGTDANRKIYGGVLFHVVGATWRTWVDAAPIRDTRLVQLFWPTVNRLIRPLPLKPRRFVRSFFIDTEKSSRDGSFNSKLAENLALMSDPEGYIKAQQLSYEKSEDIFT